MVNRFEISLDDDAYPELLKETPDPPSRIYGVGDPGCLGPGLAVIGSRRATPYGLGVTELFAGWAASAGYTVISGGAAGCDQAAHRAALAADGMTVSVMGGGADVAYPRSAQALLEKAARSGAVISEQPWGTNPLPWMFPRRNRIIAGLAVAVLVVEAGLPSGTFSTADHALASGREVLAVPGSILHPLSRGPNRLIRQGARPVTDVTDLALELGDLLGPAKQTWLRATSPEDSRTGTDPVLAALLANPMRPDDLTVALGMDVVTVSRRLGRLEAAGQVTRYPDGKYGPVPLAGRYNA